MTDREPHAPSAAPPAPRPLAADPAPPVPTHQGNGSLMSAMIATRPLPRTPPADPGRAWLARLFAGDFPFPAVPAAPLPPGDRTAAEHAAVARAAGCRDLFVVHADPVAGERVIVDIARSAAADRVLILSPNPAAADRVAERLLRCGVPVLRALADDENPLRPSPLVSKATSAAVGTARAEQARREAASAVAAAEQRVAAFAVVAKAVARLAEVHDRSGQLDADLADHAARRDRVEHEVRAETDTPLAAALAELATDHAAATARRTADLHAATADHADKAAALANLREQHAEAVRKPGLLSRLFGGKPKPGAPDPADLEKQLHALEEVVAARAARRADLQAQADAEASAFAAGRETLVAAEVATRRAASASALAAVGDERSRARAEAAALNAVISAAVPGEDHATAERQLAAARERAAEVARAAPEEIARAVAEARVVVGVPNCLGTDPVFAALPDDPPFGLLLLDRAEELPESAFPPLSRLAERWVLVGEVLPREDRTPLNGAPRPARNGRPVEPPFVVRLAKLLDREPWAVEGDRLVCRLAHLTPDQRRGTTREPLADRPEIELRFTSFDGDPLLAEIAFPLATAVTVAKTFLFHELGEVLLRPCGDLVWVNAADAITAGWPAADGPDAVWIDLEPGVREKVAGTGPCAFTAAVSFDPAAGWDAETAAAWVAKYLSPSAGRFAALPRAAGPRPAS